MRNKNDSVQIQRTHWDLQQFQTIDDLRRLTSTQENLKQLTVTWDDSRQHNMMHTSWQKMMNHCNSNGLFGTHDNSKLLMMLENMKQLKMTQDDLKVILKKTNILIGMTGDQK